MSKKFPFYKQLDQMDCGPTCLKMITKYYGKNISRDFIRENAFLTRDGVNLAGISDAAEKLGVQSLVIRASYELLKNDVPMPCIAHWRERHFIVVYKIDEKYVHVADPGFGLIKYSKEEFIKGWIPRIDHKLQKPEGIILLLEPTPEFYNLSEDETPGGDKSGLGYLKNIIKPHYKLIGQVFMGLALASIIQLIFPFLTQSIVDIGITQQSLSFINLVLVGQIFLFIAQTLTNTIRNWLLLHITSRINISLLSNFLIKLMKLPIAFFDSKTTGDLMQRLQDNTRIQTFLSSSSLNMLFSIFNVIIFGIVLLYYDLKIFLIFLGCSTLNYFWIKAFMKRRAEVEYRRFDQAAGNQSSTVQLLNGMQEIKLNGSEKRRRWEWELIQVRLFKLSIKSLSLSQYQEIGGAVLLQLMGILITYFSAKNVLDGGFTLGTMLSVQYIVGQLTVPISGLITFMQTYQDAKISLERMSEIHNKPNEVEDDSILRSTLPQNKSIVFENLSFAYSANTGTYVLKDINLEIPEGKVTAIVGSSGSGKTTLLKLLLKFYKPVEGKIHVGEHNLENINSDFWRKNVSTVMQDGYLFADTIIRNVTESDADGYIDKERVLNSVRIANIESFIEALPNGYKTRVGSSGIGLSGGQKQRMLIARAIYKNAQYLIFDEATSALDANNEKVIMENLEAYYKSRTVIVVAHRLSTVINADQIIVLDNGTIVERGKHTDLIDKKGIYYELIRNQLELGN